MLVYIACFAYLVRVWFWVLFGGFGCFALLFVIWNSFGFGLKVVLLAFWGLVMAPLSGGLWDESFWFGGYFATWIVYWLYLILVMDDCLIDVTDCWWIWVCLVVQWCWPILRVTCLLVLFGLLDVFVLFIWFSF